MNDITPKSGSANLTGQVIASEAPSLMRSARRQLQISVLRFNPQEPGSVPRMQTYEIEEADGMTLFIVLNEIREKQDPSLQFESGCRACICGSGGMMINGRPTLACRTLTKNLEPEISLAPLPVFELIGDL